MTEQTVGPVLGPVSSKAAGTGAAFIRDGAQYDVAIGGLPFVSAPSSQRPYARETAQFRAQQIDTTGTAGDQALTSYWLRGQTSFHRGAGARFYETLDNAVLNRFEDSLGVNVWTQGEATLATERTFHTSAAGQITRAASGGDYLYSIVGGALIATESDGTETATTLTANVTDVATATGGVVVVQSGKVVHVTDPSTTVTIAELDSGTFKRVWYAKGRVWAASDAQKWYMFPLAAGQTVTSADNFWDSTSAHGASAETRMVLAESPGPVYIGVDNSVYAIAVDSTSGTVAAISSPIRVSMLPVGEVLRGLVWAYGYLVYATSAGLRVGQENANGVALGPRLGHDWGNGWAGNQTLAVWGESVFAHVDDGVNTLGIEVRLSEFTSELMPAWTTFETTAKLNQRGYTVFEDGVVAWDEGGYSLPGTLPADEGWLQTGFHRFGTLELKDFRTVSVLAEGRGKVAVSLIDRAGVETPLVTLSPANFADNLIRLNLSGPTDRIALKFTLVRDAVTNESPVLLGYQLRAVPAPDRQRMIQIPLNLYDREIVGRVEYGHKGWAHERMAALEELEKYSGVVTYQDFVTCETMLVTIDRIQFQSINPTDGGSKSREGHLMVTLREAA